MRRGTALVLDLGRLIGPMQAVFRSATDSGSPRTLPNLANPCPDVQQSSNIRRRGSPHGPGRMARP